MHKIWTMPHPRKRHALSEILRKLKFSRIVSIQGPRQCGKSFFARDLLSQEIESYAYQTLDIKGHRVFAQENPASFLARFQGLKTAAIDEAQKAPDLFDEIKAKVDIDPRPGQFLLLGSTEFSREVLVKESLTGRLSRIRMFPMNMAEAFELKPSGLNETEWYRSKARVSRSDLMRFLKTGGFPGIFAVRSELERDSKLHEWIEVTAFRDLNQFKTLKLDPEFAMELLEAIAQLENPDVGEIRSRVQRDLRVVTKHLNALSSLFAISKVSRHLLGTGKDRYILCDPGLVLRLGGSFERALQTWIYLELQSQASYQGRLGLKRKVHYFRSSKKSVVHFIIETPEAILLIYIHPEESWKDQDIRGLKACRDKFKRKSKKISIQSLFLHGGSDTYTVDGIYFIPWECIA